MTKNQSLKVNIKIFKKLLDALYPDFSLTENIILNGEITSNLSDSQLTLKTPYIKYRDFQFENLNFSINPNRM